MNELNPMEMMNAVRGKLPGSKYDKRRMVLVLRDGTEVIFARIGRGAGASSSMAVYRQGKMVKDVPISSPRDAVSKLSRLSEQQVSEHLSTSRLLGQIEKIGLGESYDVQGDIRSLASALSLRFYGAAGPGGTVILGVDARYIDPGYDINGPIMGGTMLVKLSEGGDAFVSLKRLRDDDPKMKLVFMDHRGKTLSKESASVRSSLEKPLVRLINKGLKKL